ncbi:hypothetical protein QAD02_004056 [Eretmocerus hayati]|uniref:Uncharacterized protein n=1 Tax=Eretmocerus hayati TaxID=131215 RepID=A0ACC2NPH6_9HYME|nr:hypothetical protein QAD02_004056 [Eretmocerus hayati]
MDWLFLIVAIHLWPIFSSKVIMNNSTNYCYIRNPEAQSDIDFSSLSDNVKDNIMQHDRDALWRFQLCRPLLDKCHNDENYSVCLTKEGTEIGIGKGVPKVLQEFNEISFEFTGDSCNMNNNYTMKIKMICDLKVTDSNGIVLFPSDYNECDFYMIWRTELACSKHKKLNCSVNNNLSHYDLTALIDLSGNYKIPVDNQHFAILNVCHTVLYGRNTCKSTNAACLVDKSGKSFNLGEPSDNLRYNQDGTLSITYRHGAPCKQKSASVNSMETTIIFKCNLNETESLPKYSGGMEKCQFLFTWETAAACSESALEQKSTNQANKMQCVVKDPETNEIYNLTSLMYQDYKVRPFGMNEVFMYSICRPLHNSTCSKKSGSCKLHKSISNGIANFDLNWKEGHPYLNYTNGDLCNSRQQHRYTIIEFYCGTVYESSIEENGCFDVIKVSTHLVCKERSNCVIGPSGLNFNQFSNQEENYSIETENEVFLINVCQSLVPSSNLSCLPGIGICRVTTHGNHKVYTNLGYPDKKPKVNLEARNAHFSYQNGSACETDKKRNITSRILFVCDTNVDMTSSIPKFIAYNDCTYEFIWPVSYVCHRVDGIFRDNFILSNTIGDSRNLSVLHERFGSYYNVSGQVGNEYKILLTSDRTLCGGSFICDNKTNYGHTVSVLFDYTKDSVRLAFKDGSKCDDFIGLAHSSITLICDEDPTKSQPTINSEGSCHVEFEWRTDKICRPGKISQKILPTASLPKIEGRITTQEYFPLSGGMVAAIIATVSIMLIVIYCRTSKRLRLLEILTSSTSRNCNGVRYSRVNTVEEVHLLMNETDPTVIDSDNSDDDLLDCQISA